MVDLPCPQNPPTISNHIPAVPEQAAVTGMLSQANGFIISNSTLISYGGRNERTTQKEAQAMKLLRDRRVPGVEVDSSERFPPPRCHPKTRTTTRSAINEWLANPARASNMYWLLGSAGVGKSAIAQTIAEEIQVRDRLAGTFFFSRPNHRDDPMSVIPTLSYQVAVRFPWYKRLVAERLDDDPTILEKDIPSQFQLLITGPLKLHHTDHKDQETLLLVLDGLDECKDKDAQCMFLHIINESAEQDLPLAWLVCSRPEWHLQRLLPKNDNKMHCKCDELLVHGVEGRDDVYRFLCDEFANIRNHYRDELDKAWPREADIAELSDTSSGHFAFASTVIKFIGADPPSNPPAQLSICLRVVRKHLVSGNVNPMQALDLLYLQILKLIPSEMLPVAIKILSSHLVLPTSASLTDHANILRLDRVSFYAATRTLHSVLDIPTPQAAARTGFRFYHASFGDFLLDPGRSLSFHVMVVDAKYQVVIQLLKWIDCIESYQCVLKDESCQAPSLLPARLSANKRVLVTKRIWSISTDVVWMACTTMDKDSTVKILLYLNQFKFCHLQQAFGNVQEFVYFLEWLRHHKGPILLRTSEQSTTESKLLKENKVLRLSSKFPLKKRADIIRSASSHLGVNYFNQSQDNYFSYLLGHGDNTCLIQIHQPYANPKTDRKYTIFGPTRPRFDINEHGGISSPASIQNRWRSLLYYLPNPLHPFDPSRHATVSEEIPFAFDFLEQNDEER
ncbi:hypothetical protein D9756_008085 [Leucocoprinus leucothites]|uniref:NACHT domain-containing protein n=1 Tax=Leucocoprinus leucothites TaxID=201217 RepID=A0A8H5FY83_9AGAR|nr:hypothetical protein D9756_008085 [Leucoagaricus leucothites]